MTTRKFTVNHEPIGQPRHRVTTRGGYAQQYLPKSHPVHGFKTAIRLAFGRRAPVNGPIGIMITAFFPRPKSKIWKRREMERYAHTSKPDIDNVVKSVLDALNGWAWRDDAQIFSVIASKWVCGGGEAARVVIDITAV